MEKVILNDEEVFLKKDWTGWRVVEPIFHPETKKFILKNFLSKKGFLVLGFVIFLMTLVYFATQEQIANYHKVMSDPCPYCTDCRVHQENIISHYTEAPIQKINLSLIEK